MESGIDIFEILKMLPHRYPFALLDRVTEVHPGVSIRGIKNVTINEPFFGGHFPDAPIMPGVLILESLAQLAGILAIRSATDSERDAPKKLYFAGIDDARFKRPVIPGDQLLLSATLLRHRKEIWRFDASAHVGSALAAQATLTCAVKAV